MSEVKNYQRNLDNDREAKNLYVDAEVEEDEEESGSESGSDEEQIKIVAPRRKKKSTMDTMLLGQSMSQQKELLKAQKLIYKLKAEINNEEVKTRYLKLDLNNAQVRLEEELVKNKQLFQAKVENAILRVFILLYILWSMYVKITHYVQV